MNYFIFFFPANTLKVQLIENLKVFKYRGGIVSILRAHEINTFVCSFNLRIRCCNFSFWFCCSLTLWCTHFSIHRESFNLTRCSCAKSGQKHPFSRNVHGVQTKWTNKRMNVRWLLMMFYEIHFHKFNLTLKRQNDRRKWRIFVTHFNSAN